MIPMNTYKYMQIRTTFVQLLPHALAGSSPQLSVHDAHASRGRVAIRTIALPLHILVPQFGYLTRHVLEPVCSSICQYMSVYISICTVYACIYSVYVSIYPYLCSMRKYQQVWQHLPIRWRVLGTCRIECTFSLHHMERRVYFP